ncbi:hypothetical protein ACO1O0_003572 [Amphichorda felina]
MLPVPTTRTFPITLDKDGNIANLDLSYPARGWIIPTWTSGFITFAVPFAVYLLAQIRIKSAWDANSAIVGTIWAVLLATLFQLLTKALIGGFRPNFLDVCMPDIELAKDPLHNKTGLNGVGFHQVMYTIEICTQPDKGKLRTAITSFPSGHSAAGFAAFGFLFFWLNSKLKVWADYRPKFWKLTATMLPLLFAFVNSCLLTVDAAHHWYDILAGSIIGFAMAVAAYRTTYAALWDWRYNHLHLRGKEAFVYSSEDAVDYSAQTITREVGWGGKRDWLRLDPNTTGRRVTFADQTSSALPGGVTTRARPGTPAADAGHG